MAVYLQDLDQYQEEKDNTLGTLATIGAGVLAAGLGGRALRNRYRVQPTDVRVDTGKSGKRPPSSPQASSGSPKPKPTPPGSPTPQQQAQYI